MKSWQSSLKFSVSQLNQNDVTTKLFNPSVVWQGSVVFGEVIFFSYFFFVPSIFASYFFQISVYQNSALLLLSFQGQSRTELPGFHLCFEKRKKKAEPSFSSSQCQEKRFLHLFIILTGL